MTPLVRKIGVTQNPGPEPPKDIIPILQQSQRKLTELSGNVESLTEENTLLQEEMAGLAISNITLQTAKRAEHERGVIVKRSLRQEVDVLQNQLEKSEQMSIQVISDLKQSNQDIQHRLEVLDQHTQTAIREAHLRILALERTLQQSQDTSIRRLTTIDTIKAACTGRWPLIRKQTIRTLL